MAPGRYVSYRSHEASLRQFDVVALRKKECYQDCSQRSHGCNQQKDGKQRDNLERDCISGRNVYGINGEVKKVDWGSRTSVNTNSEEQEPVALPSAPHCNPGELSSRNSSQVDDGVKISGDKNEASSGMKRKFSSTEWEMDVKKKNNIFNINTNSEEQEPVALPSAPHPPQKFYEHISAKGIRKSEDLSASFNEKASVKLLQVQQLENDDDSELMGEDYVPARAISFSRWADANDSIEDEESAVYDVDITPNRRKIIHFVSSQDQSPETGEVILMEGSECSTSMASGSDGLFKTSVESMEDGVDNLDFHREESIVEKSDGLEEGCQIRTLEPLGPPCRRINMLQSCRSVDEFDKLNKINEGTYGVVYRAKDKKSGEIVALKKVKMEKEREGFPLTSLREINILLSTHHSSIVEVKEVVVGRNLGDIFLVMEYMEHDLKGLIGAMKKPFHLSEVKCLMLQLLAGVKHLHDNWVLHRDLKTSNLLFNNRGELKICDFGLSREYGNPLKFYTQLVVTLWYRAPELLLGAKEYSTAIDIWSLGCIMAELLSKEPLFPGKNELDQLDKIFRIMGTPTEKIWPGFGRLPGAKVNFVKKPFKLHEKFPRMSPTSFLGLPLLSDAGFDLLSKLLTFDPKKRITAEDAISHPWFRESPLPTSKDFMPTFPAQHMQDRCRQRTRKSQDPLEQLGQKVSQ